MSPRTADQTEDEFEAEADPRYIKDRDNLIRYLLLVCEWPDSKVGRMFRLSPRSMRRIKARATEAMSPEAMRQAIRDPELMDDSSSLTLKEIDTLLRDYACSPYTTAEERDEARVWIAAHVQAQGIRPELAGFQRRENWRKLGVECPNVRR